MEIKGLLSSFGINLGNVEEYPVLGTNYFVIIGMSVLSFSKISGINLFSQSTKAINEGGRYEPYIVEEPNEKLNKITFEKGLGTVNIMNIVNSAKSMIIVIKDSNNKIKGIYYTGTMLIESISISELEASKSNVLIQKMEISYINLKQMKDFDKYSSVFDGELLSYLSTYNTNDDIENIKTYSEKLKKQKKDNIDKKIDNNVNNSIESASVNNKTIENKNKIAMEKLAKEQETNKNAVLKNLELD